MSSHVDPNTVDMPINIWQRRVDIDQFVTGGISESDVALMVGMDLNDLRREIGTMRALGYFRGVPLKPRYRTRARGVADRRQHHGEVAGA